MTDELSPIITSLRAARAANEASIHALIAVEQMLGYTDTTPTPENSDNGEQQLELSDDGVCSHEKAIAIHTMTGSYSLCECGVQMPI
jgi:hypothetical protein